jgi:hypothetical protein
LNAESRWKIDICKLNELFSMPQSKRQGKVKRHLPIGEMTEAFLVGQLLRYGFEVFTPVVDRGSDFLALNPAGQFLRIQSKGRGDDMHFLWDIQVGQRTRLGPPTHFFFMHGVPPRDVFWLVPTEIVESVWKKTPQGTMRVRMNKPDSDRVRTLFQPYIREAGLNKALAFPRTL